MERAISAPIACAHRGLAVGGLGAGGLGGGHGSWRDAAARLGTAAGRARSTSALVIAPSGPLPVTVGEVDAELLGRPPRERGHAEPVRLTGRGVRTGAGAPAAAPARRGGGRRRRGRRGRRTAAATVRADRVQGREHGPDRHPRALRDEQLVDHAVLEDLDLDLGLARVDDRDDVAALDRVAGLDVPLEQRAGLHVGAERRHQELTHRRRLRASA